MSESNSNKTIQIGYSANDFFYNKLPSFDFTLTDENCSTVKEYTITTDALNNVTYNCDKSLIDNSMNCYQTEMCNNKQYAKQIFNINNTHGKSNIQLNDTNKEYYYQYIQTINLGIGNILLLFVIYYKIYNS